MEAKTAFSEDGLFLGGCTFDRNGHSDVTVTVVENQPHLFGEELPTFPFICQRKGKGKRQEGGVIVSPDTPQFKAPTTTSVAGASL